MAASERRHLLPSSLWPTFAQGCSLSAWPQKAFEGESLNWHTPLLPPSLMSSVLLLLSQVLPPWACPPVPPVQTLGGSPLFSWGRAPRLCCFTAGEGERTGKLSPDWDSVGTSQPAGYWACCGTWVWPCSPSLCPWLPGAELDYSLKSGTEMYIYVCIYIYIFFFFLVFKLLLENCGASS